MAVTINERAKFDSGPKCFSHSLFVHRAKPGFQCTSLLASTNKKRKKQKNNCVDQLMKRVGVRHQYISSINEIPLVQSILPWILTGHCALHYLSYKKNITPSCRQHQQSTMHNAHHADMPNAIAWRHKTATANMWTAMYHCTQLKLIGFKTFHLHCVQYNSDNCNMTTIPYISNFTFCCSWLAKSFVVYL